jgi:16S rRNA processing protein RimM
MGAAAEPVIVGKIVGLFGVKGWFKILSYTDPREQIARYQPWQVAVAGVWRRMDVENVQRHGKGVIARLSGIENRDQAMPLVGSDIAVDRQQLPALADNEFYWRDLEGLKAINPDGVELGTVRYLFATGANDVLVVQQDGGPEILVPFIWEQTVQAVDLEAGVIRVDWQEDF